MRAEHFLHLIPYLVRMNDIDEYMKPSEKRHHVHPNKPHTIEFTDAAQLGFDSHDRMSYMPLSTVVHRDVTSITKVLFKLRPLPPSTTSRGANSIKFDFFEQCTMNAVAVIAQSIAQSTRTVSYN